MRVSRLARLAKGEAFGMKAKLHEALGIDLRVIDAALQDVVDSDDDLPADSPVRGHVLRLIRAGGKRLRPILVLVGSRFGRKPSGPYVMRTAAVMEYLHTASLIHDDIIDRSALRRGIATLHNLTDVHTAVYIANYMMARAVEWAAGIGERQPTEEDETEENVRYCSELVSIIPELCLGEYVQLRDRFNFDMTMEDYVRKTRSKTALLMAHCLKAGAKAAEADEDVAQLLFDYGEALGMAFQIRDDVLDFTASESAIGKPPGSDLRNGNVTLPVLYALEDPVIAAFVRTLGEKEPDDRFRTAVRMIRDSSGPSRALETANRYVESAHSILCRLSDLPASRDLRVLGDYFSG